MAKSKLGRSLGHILLPFNTQNLFVPFSQVFLSPELEARSASLDLMDINKAAEQLQRACYNLPVKVVPEGSKYKIIDGLALYYSFQMLSRDSICIQIQPQIQTPLSLLDRVKQANNPMALARLYTKLLKELNYTQAVLSQHINKSRPSIANHLRLLSLPPTIRKSLEDKEILVGHGLALLRLSKEKQHLLHREIIQHSYTVKETEIRAKELKIKNPQKELLKKLCVHWENKNEALIKLHKNNQSLSISFSSPEALISFLRKTT